jgi:hypothetical protein
MAMAGVVDAKYSTLVGTPEQLRTVLRLLSGDPPGVVDLKFSNLVVLDAPLTRAALREILETAPIAPAAECVRARC